MTTRPPNDWPAAQREFRRGYVADRNAFPRMPVWWRVVRRVRDRGYHFKGEGLLDRLGVIHVPRHPIVAVWPESADRREPASLVLDAEDEEWAARNVEGWGELVGEAVMNGACCIETELGVIWPTYNPRVPVTDRLKR